MEDTTNEETTEETTIEAQDKGELEQVETVQETVPKEEFDALKRELDEFQDKHLRLLAEFDNFRKQKIKERAELLKYQGESIFRDLLEVIDNFERALAHKEAPPEQLREGVELIYKALTEICERWDVKAKSAIGEIFDPEIQNAINRVPSETEPPGTVISELKKAYFYKNKLIREGEVVVAVEPEKPKKEAKEDSEALEENEEQTAEIEEKNEE